MVSRAQIKEKDLLEGGREAGREGGWEGRKGERPEGRKGVCVCVCVKAGGREREKEGGGGGGSKNCPHLRGR